MASGVLTLLAFSFFDSLLFLSGGCVKATLRVPAGFNPDAGAATHALLRGWGLTQLLEPHGGEWLPHRGTGRGLKSPAGTFLSRRRGLFVILILGLIENTIAA